MSFKRGTFFTVVIVASVSGSLSGCAKFGLYESLAPRTPLQVKGGQTACLNNAGERIGQYLDGKTDPTDIEAMFQCADDSIQLFLDRTKTNTPGTYQPQELRNFLEKYFIGEDKISNALILETMEFKRSIVGGRGDLLTADELRSLRRIIWGIREQLLKLAAHRPLTIESLGALPREKQDDVLRVLSQCMADFGALLSQSAADYPTNRLEGLLREFERVFPGDTLRKFVSRINLVRALKPVLLGTSQDQFRPEEWPRFLVTMVKLFGIYVKSNPLMPDVDGNYPINTGCGEGRQKLTDAAMGVFALLESSLRFHGSLEMIPFIELDRVIDSLAPGDLGLVRPITAKRVMRPLFRRLLSGLNEGFLGREAEGVTLLGLERARRAFLDWSDNQQFIEGVYSELGRFDCNDISSRSRYSWQEIEAVSIEKAMNVAKLEDLFPRTQASVQTFRSVISGAHPLQGQSGVKLEIDALNPQSRHTFNSLASINWLSIGFVLGQQGYREKKNDSIRRSLGNMDALVSSELDQLYDDIRDLGVDLQFLDPNAGAGGGSRFRDGNLFTYAGNGDAILDLHEAVQLLAFLMSGKDASADLHKLLVSRCPNVPGGIFGTKLAEKRCFFDKLSVEYAEHFRHLPGFVAYLNSLKAEGRGKILDSLIRIAKTGRPFPDYMEILDTDTVSVLPHYIEAIYVLFDEDRSGKLETDEALLAFVRFETILKSLANDPSMSRKDLQALFTYLLDRGKAPETTLEKMGFLLWKWRGQNSWKLSVERSRILDIFEQLNR